MKKILLLTIVSLMFVAVSVGTSSGETFWTGSVFGTAFVPDVRNFDWSSSGSGNAQGLGPAGTPLVPGTTFTFRYQSYLFALNDPGGAVIPFSGLNSAFEYTAVALIPEVVASFTDLGGGISVATFLTQPGGVFYVYYDPTPNENVATGFGFDDGILVAQGTINANQISTFTYIAGTGMGIGTTSLLGTVSYANPSYLDPADEIAGVRFESNLNYPPLDSATAAFFDGRAGEGNLSTYAVAANDQPFKVDGSSKFLVKTSMSCTKNCTPASAPGQPIDISASVKNDGFETLTNINCTDDPAVTLSGVPIASLDPGSSATVTGSYVPTTDPSTDTLTCSGTGVGGTPLVTANCSATCGVGAGQCRMTGGSETTISYDDETISLWAPGTYTTTNGSSVLVTTGGQIGAPAASPIGPSFGEWEHQQHCIKKTCTGSAFGFDFKAGTSSGKSKDTTIIDHVLCGDLGFCQQARHAFFKQIFWDGIGLIKNITPTFRLPNGVACSNIGEGSLHYFKAHVGDFGEPGSNDIKPRQEPKCNDKCTWQSGGVDIDDIVLLSPVTPTCTDASVCCAQQCPCGCGDWYEIEIHCTTDPTSPVIYRFAHFIDTGNFQIHPPVGAHCP